MSHFLHTALVVFAFVLCGTQSGHAQKLTVESHKELTLNSHKKIVTQALILNDVQTAVNSMHHIIALEGEMSTYRDSLAISYFKVGNYVSSHLLATELLKTKPENVQLLEINAISLQSLNAAKEAIQAYELLFTKTSNMAHGYQLAILQFGIKRLAEAQATVMQTLNCDIIDNAVLQFPIDKTKNQNVPLKAAAYNLKGLIAFELKENTSAKEAFNQALKLMPEFAVATQNANAVTVAMQNKTQLNGSPTTGEH